MNPAPPENTPLQQEEKLLAEKACLGNTHAFAALYDHYAPVLLGLIVARGETKQAEEILELAFVKLWKEMQLPGFAADRVFIRLTAIVRELIKQDGTRPGAKNIPPGINLKALELVYFKGYSDTEAAAQLGLTVAELKIRLREELKVYKK